MSDRFGTLACVLSTIALIGACSTPATKPAAHPQTAHILLRVYIDEHGRALEARVDTTSDARFNDAAIEQALKMTFKPHMRDGKPVAAWASIPIRFDIDPIDSTAR